MFAGMLVCVCVFLVLYILGLGTHQAAGIGWLVLRKFQIFKVCAVEALE